MTEARSGSDTGASSTRSAPKKAETSSTVTLQITKPPFTHYFVYTDDDGEVRISNDPTEVNAAKADEIVASARKYGVTLKKTES